MRAATLQEDEEGLLPPASADRSPKVVGIRAALAARKLGLLEERCDELIRQEPHSFEGYFWRGFLALQRQNGYDAVRFLRRGEAVDSNPYVLKLLAVAYYSLRQFRLFVLKMHEAAQKSPDDFAPYYYLGRYYASIDVSDFNKGAEYLCMVIKRNPKHFHSHYYLGYCYEATRQSAKAEEEYRQSVELAERSSAKFALPYQGLGRLRLLENRPAGALSLARRAIELAPDDPESHKLLARAFEALSRPAEAAPEWERAAALDRTDAIPYYHLFQTYSALGKPAQARAALAKFQKLSTMYGTN